MNEDLTRNASGSKKAPSGRFWEEGKAAGHQEKVVSQQWDEHGDGKLRVSGGGDLNIGESGSAGNQLASCTQLRVAFVLRSGLT